MTVEDKWNTFIGKYNEGVEKYVPIFSHRTKFIKDWYNHTRRMAKERRN